MSETPALRYSQVGTCATPAPPLSPIRGRTLTAFPAVANRPGVGHTFSHMSKRYYLTTAIDYVNGQPHLGHAYEKVISDVIARGQMSLGKEVFFLTGLDEHGQKVQQAAVAEGKNPQEYCDELSQSWKALARKLGLANSDFIRTTEPRHKKVVQAILSRLHKLGHFYKASYKGWYSTRAESFLTDKDRLPDGTFDPSYGEVIELVEENYYFRLTEHQPWLIDYIEKHPKFIQPDYRRNEVLGFLKNNTLEDLCITRPAARLNWGIPLPFDDQYVTYVWFDALVNYISVPAALGDPALAEALPSLGIDPNPKSELWPADVHVIGKDILKFHAVFWPIMLKAIGLPLPEKVLVHGFWQKESQKISKSTGVVVDPIQVIDEWGLDAFRYYVIRELSIGPDGNWTDTGFQARYQAELANGLGNLVNRSLSMLKRYRNGVIPQRSDELASETRETAASVGDHLRNYQLQAGLIAIWELITRANQYVDQTAPFKLAKDPAQAKRLDEVLYNLCETCRILAVLLWPFLPETAGKISAQLGLQDAPNRLAAADWGGLLAGHTIGEPAALFPRKDLQASA
jgi:methionyl-tRNA synthetase